LTGRTLEDGRTQLSGDSADGLTFFTEFEWLLSTTDRPLYNCFTLFRLCILWFKKYEAVC